MSGILAPLIVLTLIICLVWALHRRSRISLKDRKRDYLRRVANGLGFSPLYEAEKILDRAAKEFDEKNR